MKSDARLGANPLQWLDQRGADGEPTASGVRDGQPAEPFFQDSRDDLASADPASGGPAPGPGPGPESESEHLESSEPEAVPVPGAGGKPAQDGLFSPSEPGRQEEAEGKGKVKTSQNLSPAQAVACLRALACALESGVLCVTQRDERVLLPVPGRLELSLKAGRKTDKAKFSLKMSFEQGKK